jgi:5-methylcytosine-specific restriction endonuclease McrA
MALVLKSALEIAAAQLEKRKFAVTSRPGRSRGGTSARYVPAAVRRAVRERDGSRCSFVSDSGKRCPACRFLEFDHAEAVARGGGSTVENVRLRCRAHNQYAAERMFGTEFMEHKRREARHDRR